MICLEQNTAYLYIKKNQRQNPNAERTFCLNSSVDLQGWPSHSEKKEIFYALNGHSFVDNKLYLSNRFGKWKDAVDSYTPNTWCDSTEEEKHTMKICFKTEYFSSEHPWMACFIGCRIQSLDPRYNGPCHTDPGFYLAFNAGGTVYIYHQGKETWPEPSAAIKTPFRFSDYHTVCVRDFGSYVDYTVEDGECRYLIARIHYEDNQILVEDSDGNTVYKGFHKKDNNRAGYFSVFNHCVKTIVETAVISCKHSDGQTETLYVSDFLSHHVSDHFKIIQFDKKVNNFILNDRSYTFEKGQFLFLSPFDLYSNPEKYSLTVLIHFNKAYLKQFFHGDLVEDSLLCFTNHTVLPTEKEMKLVEECIKKMDPGNLPGNLNYLYLFEMLKILSMHVESETPEKKYNTRVEEIMGYIDRNLTQMESIDDIASHFYISKYYLCRLFRQETGMTLVDYQNKAKVQKACHMLRDNPEISITQVATECGFNTIQYFGTVFKKNIGLTPKQFAKSMVRR